MSLTLSIVLCEGKMSTIVSDAFVLNLEAKGWNCRNIITVVRIIFIVAFVTKYCIMVA